MNNDDTLPTPNTGVTGRREGSASPIDATPPLAQAARCLETCNRPFHQDLDATDLLAELTQSFDAGGDPDLILFTQARVLDALFKRIILRDMHSTYTTSDNVPLLRDEKVNLALRSQKQCRSTLEALIRLRKKTGDTE